MGREERQERQVSVKAEVLPRRHVAILGGALLPAMLVQGSGRMAWANETGPPKQYIRDMQKLVKTLNESITFNREGKTDADFRKTADPASTEIRKFIQDYRDDKNVQNEKSFVAIKQSIRTLGEFYRKNRP